MNSQTDVTVIIPAYNAERTLRETVMSVVAQTVTPSEILIVDDCSTDGTLSVARTLENEHPLIRVLPNTTNRGVAESRNAAVASARGEWIAYLDADDLWRSDKLELQLAAAEETGAELVFSALRYIDENGETIGFSPLPDRRLSYRALMLHNSIPCSSVLVRKSRVTDNVMVDRGQERPRVRAFVERHGRLAGIKGIEPAFTNRLREDYIAWLAVLAKCRFATAVQLPLVDYRITANSRSANKISAALRLLNTHLYRRTPLPGALLFTTSHLSYATYKAILGGLGRAVILDPTGGKRHR